MPVFSTLFVLIKTCYNERVPMRHILLITLGAIFAVSAVVLGFTYSQVNEERLTLSADLQYRTRLLADSLKESVEPNFATNSTSTLQRIVDRFTDRERIVSLAVFNNRGIPLAASKDISRRVIDNPDFVFSALDKGEPSGIFETLDGKTRYLFTTPFFDGPTVTGALVTVQDASYIDRAMADVWKRNIARLIVYILIFSAAIALLIRWAFYTISKRFAESVKTARTDRTGKSIFRSPFFLKPVATEIAKMHTSLTQARLAASIEAKMRLEKLDSPWTASRLQEFIRAYLKDREFFVVTHREPYIHSRVKNAIHYTSSPSGAITALKSVMEACQGMWIAQGSGNADRETADEHGKLAVPPDEPRYTLKRMWLNRKEEEGFYRYSVEALYTLCNMTHTRPVFRKEDWNEYQRVNEKYAIAVLEEIRAVQHPIILIQDYHFTLLPRLIKKRRPDARIGLFWHVPWPSPEFFNICPERKDILEGMLGADVIGFNTQQFCNNFIDTVGKEIESLIDFERFSVTRDGHSSSIKALPISIAFADDRGTPAAPDRTCLQELGVRTKCFGLGVDRFDFVKGILERLRGVELFLDIHPKYLGAFTFVQIAAPNREQFEKYRDYQEIVLKEAERINKKFATREWRPIVLEQVQYSQEELVPLYRSADLCLITSLHDSMNLVAKEYVAARENETGVLVLSQFAGAARELKGAIIVNPYSIEEIADGIYKALTMPVVEQRQRMNAMRMSVRDYNVYRWAAELIKAVMSAE